jgi:hypothetical protein
MKIHHIHKFLMVALSIAGGMAPGLIGQSITTLNLGTQSKNPDFAALGFTRPITVGTSLPATCLVGQMYFNSSAPAGSNIYACTAANTWTLMGGQALVLPLTVANGGTGTATPGLVAGTNITVTGTWPNQTISSTGGGTSGNATTIQGVAVAATAPVNNQTLLYSSTSSNYVPTTIYTLQNGLGTTTSGTGTLQVNVSMGIRAVTATSDAILPTDCAGLVTYNNASAVAVALSQPGLAGNFLAGCPVTLRNYGAGTLTLTPSNSTIGGAATQTVATGKGCQVVSDGTNWQLGVCN